MQTLSDHILDIAQNSIRAQASRVEIDLAREYNGRFSCHHDQR